MCCINFFSVLYLHFKFLTESRPFGKAMAFALAKAVAFSLWPFLQIFKMVLFFVSHEI